jgi:1,2-diacylglycerol 3-alpha-glucosyltransferase
MKIGMFTDSYLPAHDGVATSVAAVSKQLKKLGHDVYIIAPEYPHTKDPKYVYRIFSVRIYKEPEIRVGLEIPQPALLKISAIDFDIIHGHSGGAISFLGWQLALLRNVPFVETYHTLWKFYHHYFFFPRLITPGLIKKISVLFGNDCDALIAPTHKVKKVLVSYGIKKKIYVLPSGIEREKFLHQEKGYLHNSLDIPRTTKILLTVGRLEKEKSLDFLIRAFAGIHTACPETVLVIVGEGRDRLKLQQLAYSLHVQGVTYFVRVVPYVDMHKIYADSDLFLFASRTETQGIVITEALTSGVPVVAVDDVAFDGVIQQGYNGFLVRKNREEYVEKVVTILKNGSQMKILSINAKESSVGFSARKSALSLENIYKELIVEKAMRQKRGWRKRFLICIQHFSVLLESLKSKQDQE